MHALPVPVFAVPVAPDTEVTEPVDTASIPAIVNVKSFVGEDPKTDVPNILNTWSGACPLPPLATANVYVPEFSVTFIDNPEGVLFDLFTFVNV